jgi:hypothetical protein
VRFGRARAEQYPQVILGASLVRSANAAKRAVVHALALDEDRFLGDRDFRDGCRDDDLPFDGLLPDMRPDRPVERLRALGREVACGLSGIGNAGDYELPADLRNAEEQHSAAEVRLVRECRYRLERALPDPVGSTLGLNRGGLIHLIELLNQFDDRRHRPLRVRIHCELIPARRREEPARGRASLRSAGPGS